MLLHTLKKYIDNITFNVQKKHIECQSHTAKPFKFTMKVQLDPTRLVSFIICIFLIEDA